MGIISLTFSVSLLLLLRVILRNTVLELSFKRGNILSLPWWVSITWLLFEMNFIAFLKFPWEYFSYAKYEYLPSIIIIFYSSLAFYVLSLALTLRNLLPLKKVEDAMNKIRFSQNINYITKILKDITLITSVVLIVFHIMGFKHAFIFSLLLGKPLMEIRLNNSYNVIIPSQFILFLPMASYIIAFLSGIIYGKEKKGILYLLIAILFATAQGSKAPAMWTIMIFGISFVAVSSKSFSKLLKILLISIMVVTVMFFYQYGFFIFNTNMGLSVALSSYLFRVAAGQLQGLVEAYSMAFRHLLKPSLEFWVDAFPFFKNVFKVSSFSKYLMMMVSVKGYREVGVMNSYFMMEAYPFGGWGFVLVVPFVVGIMQALGLWLVQRFLITWLNEYSYIVSLPLGLLFVPIDGGLGQFLFLKGYLHLIALMLPFYTQHTIRNTIRKYKVNVQRGVTL